jgi:hypothetical protein
MKIWSYPAFDVILLPGEAVLMTSMSVISDEIDFKPKPKPVMAKRGTAVSLHGAYQVMVDNLLGEFVIEPVSD